MRKIGFILHYSQAVTAVCLRARDVGKFFAVFAELAAKTLEARGAGLSRVFVPTSGEQHHTKHQSTNSKGADRATPRHEYLLYLNSLSILDQSAVVR
ncbi:hypothetical protein ATN37_04350 [Rhodococcus sp. MH15]|nr:hypothetical protein [Rhodococcus sp. MH15]